VDVRYRAQVPYDAPLPLVAGLTDTRGRRVRTWSRLHLPSGQVGAEATALLIVKPSPFGLPSDRPWTPPVHS
jgi:hypothetical protein